MDVESSAQLAVSSEMNSSAPLGQLLLTGVPGKELDPETAARFKKLQPGGFILFGRNIESPQQLRKLIDDLRDLSDIEPFITIDQEGGRVSRLRLIGSEPPNAQQLREKGDLKLITKHGRLTGQILRMFGFNLDLCPVLDLSFDDEADNSLKGRCWGKSTEEVIKNASVFNAEMRREGVLSSGKHFPGYASAECDPHHELPIINKTLEEMEEVELRPFRALLPDLDSIMTCHSHYPCWDADRPRWPASLSKNIIGQFLRNQLAYDGLVMTDDLDMGAILNEVTFEETITACIEAGNDLAMICHRVELVEEAAEVMKTLPNPVVDDALRRIEKTKKKMKPPYAWSLERFREIDSQIWDLRVETLGEERARELSVEDGKRSPVELY
ncbi:MAG: glycoside hydrolase family 3 N-terminal domain-containing protein [Verrucomicrobiales bacterium]|nr:glycoside hydrolase family 3 N-terminal domain-containing protein [Verrucomicrobiales bacterium]